MPETFVNVSRFHETFAIVSLFGIAGVRGECD